MRIGMFADMYKPHLSGVTNCISLLKRRYEELGHRVFVLTYGNRDYVDDEPDVIRSHSVPWGDTGWQAGLAISGRARDLIPTLDIAHVHHPFLSGRVALRHCTPHDIPIVFTNHTRYDIYAETYAGFVPRRMRTTLLRRELNSFAEAVDLVIAPSEGVREWLAEFGVTEKAVHVPNAVDARLFGHPAAPRTAAEFGFPDDAVVFCYLGRISPEKNIPTLIEAFIRLASVDEQPYLLVIGEGPGRGEAQERLWAHRLTHRVCFIGRTSYEIVPDFLAAADVFVTASVSEVHPLVVIEAMAAGLPPIGVRSPGVGDTIEHGVTGMLVNNDAEELARAMLGLTRDAEKRATMSKAAAEAAARYDIRVIADEMLGLYEGLVAARTS